MHIYYLLGCTLYTHKELFSLLETASFLSDNPFLPDNASGSILCFLPSRSVNSL